MKIELSLEEIALIVFKNPSARGMLVHQMTQEDLEDLSNMLDEIQDGAVEQAAYEDELYFTEGPSQATQDGWAMDDKMDMYRNEY